MVVYTLLMLFVSSQLLNFVVTGFSQRRTVMVVDRHWDNMRQELLNQAREPRGWTPTAPTPAGPPSSSTPW